MRKFKSTDDVEKVFHAIDPNIGQPLPEAFRESALAEIDMAVRGSEKAFEIYRTKEPRERAAFLRQIGVHIDAAREELVPVCHRETGLPEGRLNGELGRTINQLNLFAELIEDGSWIGARIDRPQPHRQPAPKPDLRQMQIPLGVVGVFGASNFPFAFSVAGGDTASALAAGCCVVVKGHPAHPKTSALVGQAITSAAAESGMPEGVFSLVQGRSVEVGMAIVTHPLVKAIGFTGSTKGGMAIFSAAASRPEPIPVFAEMGSTNPVFVLPRVIKERGGSIAKALVSSVTLGTGQFCTNPGLVLALEAPETDAFISEAAANLRGIGAGTMLTPVIRQSYDEGIRQMLQVEGVRIVAEGESNDAPCGGTAYLLHAPAGTFLDHTFLTEEVFGPSSLLVTAQNKNQLYQLAHQLEGHLTATIHGTPEDLKEYRELISILERKVGRLLFNGFPTGVEVSHAMVHGGPFPATSDSRSTSVGTGAIHRFVRPICYQDFPQEALPEALRDENPLGIWRLIDGELTKGGL